jgi:predicted secreted protein
MATAGYNYTISVSTSKTGTFSEIPSSTGTFNRTANILEVTDTTNAGFNERLVGLLDSACSAEANWSASDTALTAIESSFDNRTELWVKILPDNVAGNGKKFKVVVENFNTSLDVNSQITVSVSFQGTGEVFADDAT